jgi:hypothetical protein
MKNLSKNHKNLVFFKLTNNSVNIFDLMKSPSTEDKFQESIGEDIWSRGSLTDPIDLKSSSPMLLSFYDKILEKPKLYRYELGGILVYTSNARIAGDEKFCGYAPEAPPISLYPNSVKKLIANTNPRGN